MLLAGTGMACAYRWRPLTLHQILLIGVICVAGTGGQVCLFEGARRAPASMMATVEYSALVGAFALGFVVFGDVPDVPVFAGAGLILLAGGLLLGSERRQLLASATVQARPAKRSARPAVE